MKKAKGATSQENEIRGVILLLIFGLYVPELIGLLILLASQNFHFSPKKITGLTYGSALLAIVILRLLSLLFYRKWAKGKGSWEINYSFGKLSGAFVLSFLIFETIWENGISIPKKLQFLVELSFFLEKYGHKYGYILSGLQSIYYIVEGLLIILLLYAFQKIGEVKFKSKSVPWGGLGLMVFWGSPHFLKGISTGIYALIVAGIFGIFYQLDGKRALPVFVSWLISVII